MGFEFPHKPRLTVVSYSFGGACDLLISVVVKTLLCGWCAC